MRARLFVWLFAISLAFSFQHLNAAENSDVLDSQNQLPGVGFVLENQNQLIPKTTGFIEILSAEVLEKTGVHLYIAALESLDDMPLETKKQELLSRVKTPFALLFFTKNEKKIDIITDEEAAKLFDKKAVYWDYIIPLIPQKDADITPQAISAFLLNGFVDIADRIAESKGAELEHGFPKENKGVKTGIRWVMYVMLLALVGLFIYAILRSRK